MILKPGIEKINKEISLSGRKANTLYNIIGKAFETENDVDFDRLCVIILSHEYDSKVDTEISLYQFIIFRDGLSFSLMSNGKLLEHTKHPCMIEYFSGWGVFNPIDGTLIKCSIFIECFLMWLILSCDIEYSDRYKSDILEASRKKGLFDLYENIIVGGKRGAVAPILNHTASENIDASILPSHYTQIHMNFDLT